MGADCIEVMHVYNDILYEAVVLPRNLFQFTKGQPYSLPKAAERTVATNKRPPAVPT